jgi:hypothetical protein
MRNVMKFRKQATDLSEARRDDIEDDRIVVAGQIL